MKPRITYDHIYEMYYCEVPEPVGDEVFNFDWCGWARSPVGEGVSVKEAFLDWYNQMVEQHIDE